MNLIVDARAKLTDAINGHGRSPGHVALGAALGLSAIAIAALASAQSEPTQFQRDVERQAGGHKNSLAHVWPALFSITTLAAMRVWNTRASAARGRALALWALGQAFNALATGVAPERRSLKAVGALGAAGLTAAFAMQARKVDVRAGAMAAPMAGLSLGNLITGELWRSSEP